MFTQALCNCSCTQTDVAFTPAFMCMFVKNKHAKIEQVSMEERDFHLRAENGLVFTICRIKRESVLDYFYYNLC